MGLTGQDGKAEGLICIRGYGGRIRAGKLFCCLPALMPHLNRGWVGVG